MRQTPEGWPRAPNQVQIKSASACAKVVPTRSLIFIQGPDAPYPMSQSFSRSYGSILPTSLIYIILSTRGFSPWRPAAVMSTPCRETKLPRVDFQGSSRALRTPQRCRALPAVKPYLRTNRFQGDRPLRRKENSSQGPRRRLHLRLRCRGSSTCKCRNFNRLPFWEQGTSAQLSQNFLIP